MLSKVKKKELKKHDHPWKQSQRTRFNKAQVYMKSRLLQKTPVYITVGLINFQVNLKQ